MSDIIHLEDHSFASYNTELVKNAAAYARAALSLETIRTYQSLWKQFVKWCNEKKIESLPCTSEAIALYLTSIAGKVAYSSITCVTAAIKYAHMHAGVEIVGSEKIYQDVRRGIKRVHPDKLIQHKAKALTTIDLAMLGKLEASKMIDIRDKAIIFLCFFAAFRRSEIVSLDREQIVITQQGADITLIKSKTSSVPVRISIARAHNDDICPVKALETWLDAGDITSGPIFRALTPTGRIYTRRITGQVISKIMKRRCGLGYSGHSGRRGLITEEARRGISPYQIAKHSRHKDFNVLIGYVEQEQAFETSSTKLLGV